MCWPSESCKSLSHLSALIMWARSERSELDSWHGVCIVLRSGIVRHCVGCLTSEAR